MAGLPPRPIDKSPPREREEYPPQRRYSPNDRDRRPAARPMAQPRYREERLSEDDRVYLPRPHMEYDSYVAPQQNSRREEEVRRMEAYERDRERYSDPKVRGYRDPRERERRQAWEDRERDGRDWSRGMRTWETAVDHERDHERDRRQTYDRDRQYERRRWGDTPPYDRYREQPEHSRRDTRPPVSPRRAGPYDYPPESSFRRASRSPWRRQPSPATSYHTRRPSRPRSPPPSPQHKRLKLGSHSITTSPRSTSPSRLNHDHTSHDLHQKRLRSGRSASPGHTPPHEPAPINPDQEMRDEHPKPEPVTKEDRSSPLASLHSFQIAATDIPRPTNRIGSHSPVPIKPGSPEQPIPMLPLEDPREDKGKLKEEPQNDAEGDVKMRDPSPSPPKHPRYRGSAPMRGGMYGRRTSRSPPRGPRNYIRTPTGPNAPASFHPTVPRGSRRPHPGMVASTSASITAPLAPAPAEAPPIPPPEIQPTIPFPVIPAYKARPSLTPDIDTEITRIHAHRAHLTSEYTHIAKATRRALHELDIATIDLRAAESRRKVADAQMEKARSGVLGIDAVQVDSKAV